MDGQDPIAAVCPSKTRRTTHDRACKAFCKGWKHFLDVLGICYNERKEYEASVLFILPITLEITATVLILLKMFNCIRPLILFLEKDKIPCA